MPFSVIISLGIMIEHLEAMFWMRFVVNYLMLPVSIHERVPTFNMAMAV